MRSFKLGMEGAASLNYLELQAASVVVFLSIFFYNQSKLTRAYADWFWNYGKNGCLVAEATGHSGRAFILHRLCNLGGIPGRSLFRRSLPFPFLFTGAIWRQPSCMVRSQASLVAFGTAILPCSSHSLGTGRISPHLLLLQGHLLQIVLG